MEGESKTKSPIGGIGGGYQILHQEESQAGASTDQMQVFVLDGLKNRKWSQLTRPKDPNQKDSNSFSTPNLPPQDRELITEGEENLSDHDDMVESVKQEAKKLETRISENCPEGPH